MVQCSAPASLLTTLDSAYLAAARRSSALTLPGSRASTAQQSASASAQRARRSRASARLLCADVRPASRRSAAL